MKLGTRQLRALLPAISASSGTVAEAVSGASAGTTTGAFYRRETDGIYLDAKIRQLVGRGHNQRNFVAKLGVLRGRVHRALHHGPSRCCRPYGDLSAASSASLRS